MPLTTVQKALVTQFVQATGASEKVAQKFLKNANYKLDVAADAYFSGNPSPSASSSSDESKLEQQFEELREPGDAQGELSAEGFMKYATSLGVSPEDVGIFVLMELVKAPSLGIMTQQGFQDGWKQVRAFTLSAQRDYIQGQIRRLSSDAELFKRVYRNTFTAGRETPEQRALALDNALVYWQCFFGADQPHALAWVTKDSAGQTTNWLSLWLDYLKEKWTRTVSRDMWNQVHDFAIKTMADPSLSFYSPDGAWPSVIDSFVDWVRARGDGGMEVDS